MKLEVKKLLAKNSNNLKEIINKYMSEALKLNQDLDKKASNIQRKVNNMYETQRQDGKDIILEEKFIRKIQNLKTNRTVKNKDSNNSKNAIEVLQTKK